MCITVLIIQTCQAMHLRALAEDLVKVDKGEAVLDVALVKTLKGSLATLLADVDGLDPGLDVLLRGEFEHGLHLGAVTDVRGTNRAAVTGELLGHKGGDGLVTEADHVELTPDLEGAEVVVEVELVNGVGGVDDKVESEFVRLVPALLLGADELLSTHLKSILLLVGRVGDGVDLSTEGLGPQKSEVAKTTDTNDTDLLAGTSAEADKRRVDGQTGAEHRGCDGSLDVVGDLEYEVVVGTDVRGVTTLRDGAIRVRCTVCVDGVGAVVLLVSLAVVAGQVGTDLCTNTNWNDC
jgi:hypothetical protein